jgi:hypothetical protein
MVIPSPEGVRQATAKTPQPAVRRCAVRLVSAYRRQEAMPSLVPRLHSTCRAHFCHSCTRGRRARPTDLPDTNGVPAGLGKCATSRAGAWGSPLTSKSTRGSRGRSLARSLVTLLGGRDRGPCRRISLVSYSSEGEAGKRHWGSPP